MQRSSSTPAFQPILAAFAVGCFAISCSAQNIREVSKTLINDKIGCIASDDRLPYIWCSLYRGIAPIDATDSDLATFQAETLAVASTSRSIGYFAGNMVLSGSRRRLVATGFDGTPPDQFPDFNIVGCYSVDPATAKLTRESVQKVMQTKYLSVVPAGENEFRAIGISETPTVEVLDVPSCNVVRQFDTGFDNIYCALRLTSAGHIFKGEHHFTQDFYRFSVWTLDGKRLTDVDRGNGPEVTSFDWSEKTQLLAVGDDHGSVELFRFVGGKLESLGGHKLPRVSNGAWVHFSPDGSKLVVATFSELVLWDMTTSTELRRFQGASIRHAIGNERFVVAIEKGNSTELSVWSLK